MPEINIGSVSLSDHDRDWYLFGCKVNERSIRANTASVLAYYVRRRKTEYEEILQYTARKYGLTEEECFRRVIEGESLGDPVQYQGDE